MKKRRLGRTDLHISPMGFGCWAIGGQGYGPTKDEDSLAALETAWSHGVNFFDTADTYGKGHSESLVARFLEGKPKDEITVATKVGWDFYREGGSKKNFDAAYITGACEQSLKRLKLEAIDLYQLHNPSLDLIQKGEVVGTLEKLQQAGKIRFIGVSVHRVEEAKAALEDERVDALQLILNLLDQRMLPEVIGEAHRKDRGMIVREPLACGLLTGKYAKDDEFPVGDHRRRWVAEKRAIDAQKIERIREVLSAWNISLTQAALEFAVAPVGVSTVIPGSKTAAQTAENLKAVEAPVLQEDQINVLKELFHEELFKKALQPR